MAKKIEKSNENLRNCEFNAEELLMEPHNARVILKVLLRFIYKAPSLSLKLTKKKKWHLCNLRIQRKNADSA
jgi:hypothetical protein